MIRKCIFLGVSDESKAYRLYDPVTKKIIISRDVIFEEDAKWNQNISTPELDQNVLVWGDDEVFEDEDSDEEEDIEREYRVAEETEVETEENNDDTIRKTQAAKLGESSKRVRKKTSWICQRFGVLYKRSSKLSLLGFTDSDYARDLEDRKSTSVYVFLLNGAAICWSSRKQDIFTLSSTEAEYVAATSSVCHCVWLKGILKELNVEACDCVDIMCDNSSAIKLSKNPVMHRRIKHIDVRYHYLRDLSSEGVMKLVYCGTNDQVVDIST